MADLAIGLALVFSVILANKKPETNVRVFKTWYLKSLAALSAIPTHGFSYLRLQLLDYSSFNAHSKLDGSTWQRARFSKLIMLLLYKPSLVNATRDSRISFT